MGLIHGLSVVQISIVRATRSQPLAAGR